MELITKKKTKIVCTIGPASDTPEMIYKLYQAGMNVMRVNFSHGTHEEQFKKVEIARSFETKYGIYIPVALDTKGPEIRTGYMQNGSVPVKKGQVMRITKTPMTGTSEKFYCTYTGLYDDVKVGDLILIDDGNLEMRVIEKDEKAQEIVVQAQNDHYIKDQKGMNVPMSRLSMPYISEQDKHPQCIRCGKCVGVCPMRLEPVFMYKYLEKGDVDTWQNVLHGMDCIECGA